MAVEIRGYVIKFWIDLIIVINIIYYLLNILVNVRVGDRVKIEY